MTRLKIFVVFWVFLVCISFYFGISVYFREIYDIMIFSMILMIFAYGLFSWKLSWILTKLNAVKDEISTRN